MKKKRISQFESSLNMQESMARLSNRLNARHIRDKRMRAIVRNLSETNRINRQSNEDLLVVLKLSQKS